MSDIDSGAPIYTAKNTDGLYPRINEINQRFADDLRKERERLGEEFPLCLLLIDEALERMTETGRIPGKEFYADVFKQKPLKVVQKVFVPVRQYPKFNFIGKLLGPKGNCLRRLQEETQCKIALKGRHSIRDSAKEEELRNSGDPKYTHLHKDLYIEISALATPAESHARMAYALAEIRKFIIPDKNDEVSQEQMREMIAISPESTKTAPFAKFKQDPEEELYENPERYVLERPIAYEYKKVRPISTLKRPQSSMYAPEMKRVRETSSTSYKPKSYSILNKYK